MTEATRRTVLAGAVGVTAAAVVAACGGDPEPAPIAAPTRSPEPKAQPAGPIATTADIPINGGRIYADRAVVITQPVEGEFKAFAAICTHKGCGLSSVENGLIHCKCHGASFALTDGSVQGGPAKVPLAAKNIQVDGQSITLL